MLAPSVLLPGGGTAAAEARTAVGTLRAAAAAGTRGRVSNWGGATSNAAQALEAATSGADISTTSGRGSNYSGRNFGGTRAGNCVITGYVRGLIEPRRARLVAGLARRSRGTLGAQAVAPPSTTGFRRSHALGGMPKGEAPAGLSVRRASRRSAAAPYSKESKESSESNNSTGLTNMLKDKSWSSWDEDKPEEAADKVAPLSTAPKKRGLSSKMASSAAGMVRSATMRVSSKMHLTSGKFAAAAPPEMVPCTLQLPLLALNLTFTHTPSLSLALSLSVYP